MIRECLKSTLRPFVPTGLFDLRSSRRRKHELQQETIRRVRFEGLRHKVLETIDAVANLTEAQCADADFLANNFIPYLGLNDECLNEQPAELSRYFGSGLHLWQYPNQLSKYLVWLSRNSGKINSYLEIGCRWGGMLILISEWIQKNGGRLSYVAGIDPIDISPLIDTYYNILSESHHKMGRSRINTSYICDISNSNSARRLVSDISPDLVFIDGDHRLRGALADHMLMRSHADIITHHDIFSQACPDTTFLWNSLKELEKHEFDSFEFIDQYASVNGYFLGIGVMKRKDP